MVGICVPSLHSTTLEILKEILITSRGRSKMLSSERHLSD